MHTLGFQFIHPVAITNWESLKMTENDSALSQDLLQVNKRKAR